MVSDPDKIMKLSVLGGGDGSASPDSPQDILMK